MTAAWITFDCPDIEMVYVKGAEGNVIMARIEHTNLVVDDFSIAKRDPQRVYTHVLSHVHTDHLKGLHDGWNYGPIYCTHHTARLLLHRFPSLNCLHCLDYGQPTEVSMSQSLLLTITLLDANHMMGSAMVLVQGYCGTILYTGDIRYDRELFHSYQQLYDPDQIREMAGKQEQEQGKSGRCARQVDVLYLDNTFLKKKFDFPPKHRALNLAIEHIQNLLDANQNTRIFIALDSIGKEEVVVAIARHFETYAVVDEQRYELLKAMDFDPELFTTNPSEGIVQVVRKNTLYRRLEEDPLATGLILSGWVNSPSYRFGKRIYCVPYSLHSNFKEIHEFVGGISPHMIIPIVKDFPDENKLYYAEQQRVSKQQLFSDQTLFETTSGDYRSEMEELRHLYCSPATLGFASLLQDVQLMQKIEQQLLPPKQLDLSSNDKCLVPGMQTIDRKKYKLSAASRNEQEICRIRNTIELRKRMQEGELVQELDNEEEDAVPGKHQDVAIVLDGDDGPPEPEPVQTDPFEQRIILLKREKDRRSKDSSKSPIFRPQSEGQQPQNNTFTVDATSSLKIHTADKWQSFGKKAVQEASSEDQKNETSSQFHSKKVSSQFPSDRAFSSLTKVSMDRLDEAILIKSANLIQGHFKENPKDLELLLESMKEISHRPRP